MRPPKKRYARLNPLKPQHYAHDRNNSTGDTVTRPDRKRRNRAARPPPSASARSCSVRPRAPGAPETRERPARDPHQRRRLTALGNTGFTPLAAVLLPERERTMIGREGVPAST
jgi:hypothetical protein